MKALIATAALTAMFLSAGAFASDNQVTRSAASSGLNMTVIMKNQVWPMAGQAGLNPCDTAVCIDI